MAEPKWGQVTAKYKTYLKRSIVEALRTAWADHPDSTVKKTKVDVEFPTDRAGYPAVIVRFYERDMLNSGVAHFEYMEDPDDDSNIIPLQRMIYHGDVEFTILGLSSYDRDVVSDALVQTIKFGQVTEEGKLFRHRIFFITENENPYSVKHYVNVNTDQFQGFGESQSIAPWMPEDVLVYQVSYRLAVLGEVISPVPAEENYGLVEAALQWPYMPAAGEARPEPDPEVGITPWTSELDIDSPPIPQP